MRSTFALCVVVTALALACASPAEKTPKEAPAADRPAASGTETAAVAEKCEHGVDKTLCTRCDPRLEPVFKAKGDWCAEHTRPESQCAICHPELAALGVK
jgi:hypothetical protein